MGFKDKLINLKNKLLNLVYPSGYTCIFCDRDLPEGYICHKCQKEHIFNNGNRCQVCDTPIKEGNIVCDYCKKTKRAFKTASCPFLYDEATRKSLLKFKSDGAKYLAKPFAKYIFERLSQDEIDFDVIVPVPSHKKTIRKRGYNPARLLADELSLLSNKPVLDILIKTTLTQNQKFLDAKSRQENLENTITLSDSKLLKGKKVLIVDDIITTGSTINACALLMTKASEIHACSVARRKL